ncbi:hypothetical protein ACFE04_010010 [Oxalis oulophora]
MDHCNQKQNVTSASGLGSIFSEQKETVICPRPRRVSVIANSSIRPLRWQMSNQAELSDSAAGAELLDLIRRKEGYGVEQSATQVASSPPFYGSPPSRASNPLVQDARFKEEKYIPSPFPISSPSNLLSPSSRKGGCVRMAFGLKPAAVRVEGFDCLNRDRQNSSISAMA